MIRIAYLRQRFGAEAALIVLLFRIYFRRSTVQDLSTYLQAHQIRWDIFCQLLREYEIRPLIFKTVTSHGISLEASILEKLKGDCFFLSGSNLKRLQEALRLLAVFQQNGIRAVPFKGVFLSQALFDDLSTREACDIDFLVDEKDTIITTNLLIAEGYESDYYFKEKNEPHLRRISCERGFTKPDEGLGLMSVEIHWEVLLPSSDVPLCNKDLFADLQQATFAGRDIELLNTENTLVTLIAHHGVTDVWRTIKHLVDLAAFLDQYPAVAEAPSFQQRLKKIRLYKTASVGMQLAELVFGTPVPAGFKQATDSVTVKALNTMLGYPMLTRFKYAVPHMQQHLRLRDNIFDQVRLLGSWTSLLFLPTANDLRFVELPKSWFFLYYLIKPWRLLLSYFFRKALPKSECPPEQLNTEKSV